MEEAAFFRERRCIQKAISVEAIFPHSLRGSFDFFCYPFRENGVSMVCSVQHESPNFSGVDHSRPEFHGLMLPRSARGEIDQHIVESPHVSGVRMVRVFVPAAQFQREELPIVVLNDGHKAFEPARERSVGVAPWEQSGTLQLHRIMDGLMCQGLVKPSILVALLPRVNTRIDEALPTSHTIGGYHVGGEGDQFVRFLEHDVLRVVYENYQHLALSKRPEGRVLVGSSVGGYSALYAALQRPEIFGGVIAMSPSAWIGDGELARLVTERRLQSVRLALDIGESEAPHNKEHCQKLFDACAAAGWRHDADLMARFRPGAHNEDSWRQRIPELLEFVIPGPASRFSQP